MDLYLTRLPMLGRLILRTPSSDSLGGLPVLPPEGFVGIQFLALVMIGVLLACSGGISFGVGEVPWVCWQWEALQVRDWQVASQTLSSWFSFVQRFVLGVRSPPQQ